MSNEGNIVEAAAYTVGGTGMVSLLFMVVRHMLLRVSKDVTTVQGDITQRELLGGLREEVSRLEALVDRMQKSIDSHTAKIAVLESQVTSYKGSAMVALTLVESIECECKSNRGMREKLIAVLHRMAQAETVTG